MMTDIKTFKVLKVEKIFEKLKPKDSDRKQESKGEKK